jgi:serine/threonine protein kinase
MSAETAPRGFRPGAVIAGRYALKEPIGAGGMGTVYRATQLELDREVALKVIGNGRGLSGSEAVARFEREARMLARLSHPSIVTVHDFGNSDGTWFLVLELVRGETVRERLGSSGALAWNEALDIGLQIAEALAYAHGAGVLHRDLKPANVMLSAATSSSVKLVDFGLARLADVTGALPETDSAYVVGTPGYIAPEYARAGVAGPAVDVYALGVVLFEMLTARHPFDSGSPDDRRALRERLYALAPATPASLKDHVLALLDPDPTSRPGRPATALARIRDAELSPALEEDDVFRSLSESSQRRPATSTRSRGAETKRPMVEVQGAMVTLKIDGGRTVEVRVPSFLIDKHLVTCGDYLRFVEETGARPPSSWSGARPPRADLALPVVGVGFDEASAYAVWAGRRLPTEAEWELAARGARRALHPWGAEWQTGMSHPSWSDPFERRRPGPIGVFSPQGDSPSGMSDLLQIWEWVVAPYQVRGHLVRGGPWRDRCVPPTLENRSWEDEPAPDLGFRCACALPL